MTPLERVIENQHFIEGIHSRITRLEKQQARGIRVEPVFIAVAENSMDFISTWAFEEDRIELDALRARLKDIRLCELSRPKLKNRTCIPLFG